MIHLGYLSFLIRQYGAKFSKNFWAKVVNITCYLVNKSQSIVLELKNSYEVWYSSLADYSKLKVFSCLTYIDVKKDTFRMRMRKYIFLGYAYRVKRYQLQSVDPRSAKFITSRDLTFDESIIFCNENESSSVDVEMNQGTKK